MRLTGAARWPIETAFRRPVSAKLTAVVMKYSHSAVAKYFVIMLLGVTTITRIALSIVYKKKKKELE